jgi:SAM-dependent methyltransferase
MKKEEKEAIMNYAKSAKAYHNWRTKANPKGWFYNEHLEMPATLQLLGNVKRKKILDFGCGTGIYGRLLTKKGAIVKGFDISKEMLEIAKEENPKLDLREGSGYKIPFKEKFDIVLSSLTVHYLKDWNKMFKEVSRVLKPKGLFIFSTNNPVFSSRERRIIEGKKVTTFGDYFKEEVAWTSWRDNEGKEMKMMHYNKTYETIISYILKNDFEIVGYKDCFPTKESKKLFPKDYAEFSKKPFFCVWKVRKR